MKICSPQLENGHTRIANELLEAILTYPFSSGEMKVLFTVIRLTYGWQKKRASISYSVLSAKTGICVRHAKRMIRKLVRDKILIKEKEDRKLSLGINKQYLQWRLWITPKAGDLDGTLLVTSECLSGAPQVTGKVLCRSPHRYKEIFKESLKKENSGSSGNGKTAGKAEKPEAIVHIRDVLRSIS